MIHGALRDNITFKDHDHDSKNFDVKMKKSKNSNSIRFEDQIWKADTGWSSNTVGTEHSNCHQALCCQAEET